MPSPALTTPPSRTWITRAQAAEHLQCTERHVDKLIARGELTGYRLGSRIRLDLTDVDALLQPIRTVGGDAA